MIKLLPLPGIEKQPAVKNYEMQNTICLPRAIDKTGKGRKQHFSPNVWYQSTRRHLWIYHSLNIQHHISKRNAFNWPFVLCQTLMTPAVSLNVNHADCWHKWIAHCPPCRCQFIVTMTHFANMLWCCSIHVTSRKMKWRSHHSSSLRSGQSGDRTSVGARFSAPVQTSHLAHTASCAMGDGSLCRG